MNRARIAWTDGLVRWLAGCVLLFCASGHCLAVVVEAPLRIVKNIPLVQVKINGHGPYWFVLDTGVDIPFLISERLVNQLDLPQDLLNDADVLDGDATEEQYLVRDVQLRLEDFQLNCEGMIWDLRQIRNALGEEIDGILGMAIFEQFPILFTLDYPRKKLIMDTRRHLSEPNGKDVLPLCSLDGYSVPAVESNIGGIRIPIGIDSGSNGGLDLPSEAAGPLKFKKDPVPGYLSITLYGRGRDKIGRADGTLAIGKYKIVDPIVAISPGGAKIGGELLRHFRITFDLDRNLVQFERSENAPIRMPPERTPGVVAEFVTPSSHVMEISDIIPGTPAEDLDIRIGDQLIAVNGRPVKELDRDRELVDHNDVLTFTLMRDERKFEVDVPVVELVP